MAGGDRPQPAGNAYFALYCMAMRTGRARSADEIGAMLRTAGFEGIAAAPTRRPFLTSVVTATKPGTKPAAR